jgi:hypothetical protein
MGHLYDFVANTTGGVMGVDRSRTIVLKLSSDSEGCGEPLDPPAAPATNLTRRERQILAHLTGARKIGSFRATLPMKVKYQGAASSTSRRPVGLPRDPNREEEA